MSGHNEDENLVCSNCTAEFVAGWVEEYGTDRCPDCESGGIISKAQKKKLRRG